MLLRHIAPLLFLPNPPDNSNKIYADILVLHTLQQIARVLRQLTLFNYATADGSLFMSNQQSSLLLTVPSQGYYCNDFWASHLRLMPSFVQSVLCAYDPLILQVGVWRASRPSAEDTGFFQTLSRKLLSRMRRTRRQA